jgi:hypothetical protein
LLLVGFALGLAALGFANQNAGEAELVVHEWGTFTSIAGEDGAALEWRPLAAANDLPGFVHDFAAGATADGLRHDCQKCDLTGKIRMETPVLYFYTERETNVSVRVDFPKGSITEWYPSARTVGAGIDWGRIAVTPHTTTNLLVEAGPNHYYAARETDAALVRVCNTKGSAAEFEKFLFYRGVGGFDPPISVVLDGNRLECAGLTGIAQVIVFENRSGNIGFRIVEVNSATATVERPGLGGSLPSLVAALQHTFVASGLYEKEAQAMLETWRDSWFEEGLRVFYVLPRTATDAALPLTIDPRPARLVRVLVGRVEVITPEVETRVLADPKVCGRFAEPVLKRVLAHTTDAALKKSIERLLKQSRQS